MASGDWRSDSEGGGGDKKGDCEAFRGGARGPSRLGEIDDRLNDVGFVPLRAPAAILA